jgi:hypothetical protein
MFQKDKSIGLSGRQFPKIHAAEAPPKREFLQKAGARR